MPALALVPFVQSCAKRFPGSAVGGGWKLSTPATPGSARGPGRIGLSYNYMGTAWKPCQAAASLPGLIKYSFKFTKAMIYSKPFRRLFSKLDTSVAHKPLEKKRGLQLGYAVLVEEGAKQRLPKHAPIVIRQQNTFSFC